MAATFIPIQKIIPNGSSSTVSFTSIPATYTDLVIFGSSRVQGTGNDSSAVYRFNSDTGANYSYQFAEIYDNAAVFGAKSTTNTRNEIGNLPANGTTTNTYGSFEIYIPNYAGDKQKISSVTSTSENSSTTAWEIWITANLWRNTAAITQIDIIDLNGYNFTTASRFDLYGIKNSA